jgi:hypothetical protein
MKIRRLTIASCTLVACACVQSFAQGLFGFFPDDRSEILHELLGTNFAFSAKVRLSIAGETNSFIADLSYFVLNRKIRTDFVISEIPGLNFPSENLAKVIHCGLDRTTAIMRPDMAFFVYTNRQAWVDTMESTQFARAQFKLRKTEIDRETIGGHPCVKYDVFASGGGHFISAVVWEATDMGGFPIRMDWTDEGLNWSVVLSAVDTKPPKAGLFEIPAGYKRYSGFKELVRATCTEAVVEEKK